ncbi:phosphoadenosine phosphosulfate reductase family protein [Acinetobacter higginsii]|uniref:phosphoadenosine phosphosulfate reductase domain-containing protein n=1 Tax=Acinetobacter higginsii TaxID=70347 RepID=UPI001F4B4F2A|nr:phosphoadenosine phosphosulfate reductase family protein [Acinetobacter higginsii]MCH7381304.1 phosphoadenosine phosphosulfate reductase family protein [Acinetobacter higginsii]
MIHELAIAEIHQGALFVINHSGGKDSQAMMIKLLEFVPKSQILVVHASLGEMEWHGALEHAQKQADDAGVPFIVACAIKSFLEMVLHKFKTRVYVPSWPSSANRQCTSDLKRDPIKREVRRFANANGFTRIVNCMGMRAEESTNRAKKAVWEINKSEHGRAGRSWHNWLPIHALNTKQVFETIAQAGQQTHWAYRKNDRLSCVFCIFASVGDLIHGATIRPELYALYCKIEEITGYTMHMSMESLPQITGIQPDYLLLGQYTALLAKFIQAASKRKYIPMVEIVGEAA